MSGLENTDRHSRMSTSSVNPPMKKAGGGTANWGNAADIMYDPVGYGGAKVVSAPTYTIAAPRYVMAPQPMTATISDVQTFPNLGASVTSSNAVTSVAGQPQTVWAANQAVQVVQAANAAIEAVNLALTTDTVPPAPSVTSVPAQRRSKLKRLNTQTVTAEFDFDFEGERDKDKANEASHRLFHWLGWAPAVRSPCYNSLHHWFPGALPGNALHSRSAAILAEKYSFTPENTLFGTSICPDEINNEKGDLPYLMHDYWGELFPLGGISGAPFAGKTGFKAFSHHVPHNGNVLVLFGPHVAISEAGEVGDYLREGQDDHSAACGAVIGAYKHCCQCAKGGIEEEIDDLDMQMNWIKHQLSPHCSTVQAHENPMAALAHQAYEMVKAKTLGVVNNDFGSGYLVLIGGIQINMPKPCDDHFLPCMFEIRKKGYETEDLLSSLEHPEC